MDALERRLAQLVFRYWKLPERDGRHLLKLLVKSPCTRVQTLRNQLALADTTYPTVQGSKETDMTYTFARILTPRFLLDLLQDLESSGGLTHQQTVRIGEAMLAAVSAEGEWKAV